MLLTPQRFFWQTAKPCYIVFCIVFFSFQMFSQTTQPEDSLPTVSYIRQISIPEYSFTKNQYEELRLHSSEKQIELEFIPVLPEQIYGVNPFELDDASNPFNLPKQGYNQFKIKENKAGDDVNKFFSELFKYKSQPKKKVSSKQIVAVIPAWLMYFLFAILCFYSFLMVSFRTEILKIIRVTFNITISGQIFREQKSLITLFDTWTFILYVLSTALYLYLSRAILQGYEGVEPLWSAMDLFYFLLSVALVFIVKWIQLKITGMIFSVNQLSDYFTFTMFQLHSFWAYIAFPFVFIQAFVPDPLRYFLMGLLGFTLIFLYLYRYFRMILVSIDFILSNKLHFFIYICSVEILPILIVLKYFSLI